MKIAKFQPDAEGILNILRCVNLISIGLQRDIPTVIAIVAEGGEVNGKNMQFYFKLVGDSVTQAESTPRQFVAALMGKDIEYLMYKEPTSIIQEVGQGPVPPGMTPGTNRNFERF